MFLFPFAVYSFIAGAILFGRKTPAEEAGPLPSVTLIRWRRFTRILARHPQSYDTPRGHLGMYGMTMRGLADVGFAGKPQKTTIGRETGVWAAPWKAPLTKEKFLASPKLQNLALERQAKRLYPKVLPHVGATVDGTRCTLSGLLSVGFAAGDKGVASWIANPKIRKRFAGTTELFAKTNGVF